MTHYKTHPGTKTPFGAFFALSLFLLLLATAQSATITLGWNANSDPSIAGYRVYYGTASHSYFQQIDAGNSTSAIVASLNAGTTYYFATTAYNTIGVESGYSGEVAYTPPVQTPTPAPTPTPATALTLSGNIYYCPDSTINPVPNVTLTRTGTSGGSAVSDSSGNYQFPQLLLGIYTITPTKTALPPGTGGITTYDVVAIRRHFLGLAPLQGCALTAANVNGDGQINTSDMVAVQKFYLGQTTGTSNVGKYLFTPANRTYTSILGTFPNQNFSALVLGDVTAPFADRPSGNGSDVGPASLYDVSNVAEIDLPQIAVDQSVTDFSVDVTTSAIDIGDKLIAFQGDFTFDERVVTFQDRPVQVGELTAANWNVSANVLPGDGPIRTLRISAYSGDFTPLSGAGTLFKLNLTRVGDAGATTALTWSTVDDDSFVFIDADLGTNRPTNRPAGAVTIEVGQP